MWQWAEVQEMLWELTSNESYAQRILGVLFYFSFAGGFIPKIQAKKHVANSLGQKSPMPNKQRT
jgi:hypothetical protein